MKKFITDIQNNLPSNKILYTFGSIFSLIVTFQVVKSLKYNAKQRKLLSIAKQVREKRDQYLKEKQIPDHGLSQQLQTQILNSSLIELKQMLDQNKFTSEQLLNFYAKRMHTKGLEYKLISQSNYEEALKEAKICDELRKQNIEEVKQKELFGIVISTKDTFDIKGLPSSIGCISKVQNIKQQDGITVQILKNAGAIIFAKCNVSQATMAIESTNNIWGTALNPWNKDRTTGGSSGGSAGSVALQLTPLCFAVDLGGSTRIPAVFNGVTGFKPCSRRVPQNAQTFYGPTFSGQISILPAVGPIGKFVDDCAQVMEAYFNGENYKNIKKSQQDMYLNLKSWDKSEYQSERKMRIGYFKQVKEFPAVVSVQRAVQESIDGLKQNGHSVIEIVPPFIQEMQDSFLQLLMSDQGQGLVDLLEGEEPLPHYSGLLDLFKMSQNLKNFISKMLSVFGQKRLSHAVRNSHGLDSYQYRNMTYKIQQFRIQYIKLMEDLQLDCIICPAFGTVAGQHNFTKDLFQPIIYSTIFNLLDFPAGVVPVTVVQENEQFYEDGINDAVTKLAKNVVKDSKGLPVGVQVVSYPFKEEIVMNVMKQIEKNAGFYQKYKLNK